MRKLLIIYLLISLQVTVWSAASSSSYSISSQGVGGGGGNASSSSYKSNASAGAVSAVKMSSASYLSVGGSINGGGAGASQASDTSKPSISNVKIDSKSLVNNDTVSGSGTLTAIVSDETAISVVNSSIEVDRIITTFAALTGASTYDVAAKSLTCVLSLSSGSHTIKILAVDTSGNSTSFSRTVQVDSGAVAASSVLSYPNPFNPSAGNAKIAYTLNSASDLTIYIFNAIGQKVFKRDFVSGASGATAGYNEYSWDGKGDDGQVVGNDLYFVRIVSAGKIIGKAKLAVLK